jgi:type VI secretion system secreted protein VgrG
MPVDKHAFSVEGVDGGIEVLEFHGHEGLSQLFELVVTIAVPAALDATSVVQKGATLEIKPLGAATPGTIHGIVARIEGESLVGGFQYRVTVVPKVWLQLQGADSRIFQALAVPAIVQQVLKGGGLNAGDDFRLSLQATYATREYCVQYRESNWDFVCRLCEEEGIYFYFEQSSAGHKVVFADTTAAYPPIEGAATLVYKPQHGAMRSEHDDTRVLRFHVGGEVRAGKVTLRDWNFLKPSLSLEANSAGSVDASLEVYDYPGEYQMPDAGTGLAKVRLEEIAVRRASGGGESTCSRLLAGHTFSLTEHGNDGWNAKYVVTRLEYWGRDPVFAERADAADRDESPDRDVFRNSFEVIAATTLFRPPRVTHRPHIHGVQTAIVVGPAGEEIYTDQNGRVKVQFHWDRFGKNDDKSSCWVRVAQMWASSAFGAMFLPRVKDEVVIAFLEGNPDEPLVVGSVYHGTNVPPYALPGEKTKSTIKSNSSKGGGGFNELRFEDKKGSEEVFLQAQKDWTINVLNDKNQKVGHDETLEVDNDRTKTVKHDQTATIQNDDKETVQHDQTLTVQNDRSVTVQNDHTETVQGKQTITVTKAQSVTLSDKQEITVDKTRAVTVTGDVTETYKAKLTREVTSDVAETLSAKRTVSVKGDDSETVGGKQTISITGDSSVTVSGKHALTVTGNVTITSGSSTITVKPSGEITISGAEITVDASGPLKVHGATVDVKSDGPMNLQAPVINGKADGMNTLKGAMVVLDAQMISVG